MHILRLPQVHVASPCPARWDEMDGDAHVRFCHQCTKHVYDLTAMDAPAIHELIRATEGRFCGRLYQRGDGRHLTSDCPVGIARVRRRLVRAASRAAAIVLLVFGGYGYVQARSLVDEGTPGVIGEHPAMNTLLRWTNGRAMVMGLMGSGPPPARSNRERDGA